MTTPPGVVSISFVLRESGGSVDTTSPPISIEVDLFVPKYARTGKDNSMGKNSLSDTELESINSKALEVKEPVSFKGILLVSYKLPQMG